MGIVTSSLFNERRTIPIATGRVGGNEKFNNGDGEGGVGVDKGIKRRTQHWIKQRRCAQWYLLFLFGSYLF